MKKNNSISGADVGLPMPLATAQVPLVKVSFTPEGIAVRHGVCRCELCGAYADLYGRMYYQCQANPGHIGIGIGGPVQFTNMSVSEDKHE